MNGLRIGELARQAGVNLQTIHYYERRGLLPEPPRSEANYRVYSEEAVLRVRFIKRSQQLGFTLREIQELLSLRAEPGCECGEVLRRAEAKVREVDEKIRTLRRIRKALIKLMNECSGEGPATECPILDALDSKEKF